MNATPEHHYLTTSSTDLGLNVGCQEDLDATAAQFSRRDLALRITAALSGLWADQSKGFRTINQSFANVLGSAGANLRTLLAADAANVFLEPLQQLVFLRRTLSVPSKTQTDIGTAESLGRYFDGSRFASDITAMRLPDDAPKGTETTLRIAADFLKRLSILNPPHPTNSLARLRLMFRDLPQRHAAAGPVVERLRQRFVDAFGLSFDDVSRLAQLFTLWSLRFSTFEQLTCPL